MRVMSSAMTAMTTVMGQARRSEPLYRRIRIAFFSTN
jgi:hypothetical protein